MSAFIKGFEKVAGAKEKAVKGAMDTITQFGRKASVGAGGYLKGVKSSGDVALKEHLNPMTAVKHYQEAFNAKGLKNKMIAAGKALPSTVATGGYLYGGKKIYDKTLGDSDSNTNQYMLNSYYN